MPLLLQYFEFSHSESLLVPLLALQATQHRAMFSLVIILASLIMCSHEACVFLDPLEDPNLTPQYTHTLSLASISFSSHSGIFQLFIFKFFLITSQITQPSANVTEQSGPAGLSRPVFTRSSGRRARSEHVYRPTNRVASPAQVCRPRLAHAINQLRQVRIIRMGAGVL